MIQDHSQRKLQVGFTIVVDRVLGIYVMSLVALTALLTNYSLLIDNPTMMSTLLGVFSLSLFITLFGCLSFSKRLKKRCLNFLKKLPGHSITLSLYESLHSYRKSKKTLLYAMGLSVIAQLLMILCFVCVGYILGEKLGVMTYFFAVPLGFIISAIPIAPAGIGVGQVAMLFFFEAYSGITSQVGPIGLSIVQLLLLTWGLIGAYFYLRWQPRTVGEI